MNIRLIPILLIITIYSMGKAGEIIHEKLKNGAELIIKPREDTEAVALHVWFRVGSIYENYKEKGMAHFLEHMLFNGSEKYGYGEIEEWVEGRGGNINAGTSKDFTYYHIEIAYPYWEKALELLYYLTMKAKLDEGMIEKEKPIVIEELRRGKDNPRRVLWEEFEKEVYKVSPYRFPIIGFERTIKKFNREMLINFYKNFYQPKNMIIVIVGKVDPERAKEIVKNTFGKEEGRKVPKVEIPKEPEQIGIRYKKIEDPRVTKAYWIIGWRVPPAGTKEHYTLLLIDQILGTGKTSLLYRELKEKGLVYSISSSDFARPRDNIFVISASFDPEKYGEVKKKVFEIMENLRNLSEEEIKKAKERIINSIIFERERVESEAYEIGYLKTVLGTLDPYLYFESNIRTVRRIDIIKFLERYFNDKNYVEVIMLPAEKDGREEVDIATETLENGVRIIAKSTEGRGIVSGTIFIKGGLHREKKKGITNLTISLLTKGTKNYNSYQIASTFEDYGGYIYTSSSDDFSEIGFSTKVEGLEKGVRVIEDMIFNPTFSEEDIEKEKKNIISEIRSKRERGMSYAMEHLRKLTYKGTPYEVSPLGREEDIKSISREDVLNRWKELLKGGNIVVSVVGDMQAKDMIDIFKKVFSKLPSGSLSINEDINKIEKNEILHVRREGTQATILCAFNAPEKESEDYFSFKVFNSILGDGMTSKLHRELREKRGYAYATYSFYPTRYGSPRMFSYIGTSPEKREKALEDMIKVIKNPEISEGDIEMAINKIVGDFLLDHQTRSRQSWYLGFYEVMGLGWRMDKLYPERIRNVNKEDVERIIKKYIDNYHCVVVSP